MVGNRFEMIWPYTGAIPAQMIKFETIGNRPNEKLIKHTVSVATTPQVPVPAHFRADPLPASIANGELIPDTGRRM